MHLASDIFCNNDGGESQGAGGPAPDEGGGPDLSPGKVGDNSASVNKKLLKSFIVGVLLYEKNVEEGTISI